MHPSGSLVFIQFYTCVTKWAFDSLPSHPLKDAGCAGDSWVSGQCAGPITTTHIYLFIYLGLTVCLLGVRGSVCQMAQQVCRLAGGHVAPRRRWRGSQSERGGNGVGALPLSLAQLELCYIIKYGKSWAKTQMFALSVRITEQQALRFFFLGGH